MKKHYYLLFVLILALGFVLGACGGEEQIEPKAPSQVEEVQQEAVEEQADTVEPEPAAEVEPTEESEAEMVVETVEEVAFDESEMDAAFDKFLSKMVKYNTIGLDSLNEQLIAESQPFLLDVRQPEEHAEKGHIEGAINVPLRELGEHLDLLPAFESPIVSYCGSGWRCTIAMTELGALGWGNVLSLKGGSFGGWAEAGYPIVEGAAEVSSALDAASPNPAFVSLVSQALSTIPEGWGVITADQLTTDMVENPDLVLIDVRTTQEVEEKGYIEADNFYNIPLEDFIARKSEWPADKSAEIVIYCGSGHRSTMAMSILQTYGYENVRSLKGGFGGWAADGYPVAGGKAVLDDAYSEFLGRMVKYNTIGLDALNEQLIGDPPPFVLDVRQPEELVEKGHIEGAVHIPLRELAQNVEILPSFDTPIVSYCGSGWRCTIAMTELGALGWENVRSLKGGSYGGWVEAGYPTVEGAASEALVLDIAKPDPKLLAKVDSALSNIPEGWGVIAADQLATELVENPDLVVIDVRKPEEVAEKGYIDSPNFVHLPLETFVDQQEQWPADKDTPIVIYCGSGIALPWPWPYFGPTVIVT